MNYPTETEHEAMGQRKRSEGHGKVISATVVFFFLPSYIPHALRKESTIKRSVDNLELFDDQRRGFRQLIS